MVKNHGEGGKPSTGFKNPQKPSKIKLDKNFWNESFFQIQTL